MGLATPTQPVSIDSIEFDAILEGTETLKANVPSYPVDDGYSVSDNASLEPKELSMSLFLTATPVTWSGHGTGLSRVLSVCNRMRTLYTSREPVTVETQDGSYSNMVIEEMSIKKSPDLGIARQIDITLCQITYTSSETVEIPSTLEHSGTSEADAGSASTNSVSATVSSSNSSASSSSLSSSLSSLLTGGSSGSSLAWDFLYGGTTIG